MKFGVPSQRVAKKPELFPNTPILTVGIDAGKGKSRTMTLNPKAIQLLGLEEENATIAFGFEDGKAFVTNGENASEIHQIKVTKGSPRKVSEKRTYTYLSEKVFDLNNEVENHLQLLVSPVESEGDETFQLQRYLPYMNVAVTETEDMVEAQEHESVSFEGLERK